ncbi:MAG: class I SAM-dependent methyltransferase [Bosea sp.]|jgi:ubiquinone/menaquinone biosynthesis C-methylase UbiE|nr:class I SAM-dependent methyltransferase [Bosea sp. (in: a-proteobacteria)]
MTASTPITEPAPRSNFGLKDEIRAYWTKRAETFDHSWGHKIRTAGELEAWCALFRDHGAIRAGFKVLELASGTGEVTRALVQLGCRIDAIDLCETMIERAKAKHPASPVQFHLADAENTMMPDSAYDLVVTRHLVWTLTAPAAALADWFRVLKPGQRVVIVDGDWVRAGPRARFLKRLSALLDRLGGKKPLWDQAAHERIMNQLPFRDGLTRETLIALLRDAGFVSILSDDLTSVRRHQWRAASWSERLRLLATYEGSTFIVSAAKPTSAAA